MFIGNRACMPEVAVNEEMERSRAALNVPAEKIPAHVAIIMDGNGRWAQARGLPRIEGHKAGAKAVRDTVAECGRLGVRYLTLYSFSIENWKRPREEINALMELLLLSLQREREKLLEHDVRLVHLGRREGLPEEVLRKLDETVKMTSKAKGPTLALALNYSARAEITDALRAIAGKVAGGRIDPADIDEQTISDHLYTAGMPDPDLLIRTAGEMRVSNYLLWQISYAELHVTEAYWPDFGAEQLHAAIRDYAGRQRRFGALSEQLK